MGASNLSLIAATYKYTSTYSVDCFLLHVTRWKTARSTFARLFCLMDSYSAYAMSAAMLVYHKIQDIDKVSPNLGLKM